MFTKYKNIICEKYYFANIKYHKGDVKEMYRKHLKRNKQNKMDYTRGITLVALVITILFSYDEKIKCSNSKGFLQTI